MKENVKKEVTYYQISKCNSKQSKRI